jgi:uncharacterized membrane-anchored protein YhcB (DUF1043 family)
MKPDRVTFIKILLLTLAILVESPTIAQADIIATPKTVTINAVKGESITRTISLRVAQDTKDVKVIALDAFSADNTVVLPAKAIQITAPPTQINADRLTTFPVTLNLQSVPSGEFTGEILLTSPGSEKSIPLIVRIKDPWFYPLATLVLGVSLGMAVSAYGSKGKLSDEVIVNLQNLRTQIEPDKTAARSFWERTDSLLNIAQQALDAKQVTTAQTNLDNAKIIWNKWLQQRSNWLLQFEYYDSLCQRLKAKDLQQTSTLYLQAIDRDLSQTLLVAPELSTPNDLQKNLTLISEQLNRYISLNTQLEKLKLSINTLEGDRLKEWEDKTADFSSQLQTLIPSQSVEIQALQTAINTGIETVKGLGMPVFTESKGLDIEPGLVLQAPAVESTLPPDNFALRSWTIFASLWLTPKGRLRLFQLSTYLISFTVLAGGGFDRLYASKSTFGANGWSDYFSLLVLGFGAEATRNVVTQVAGKKEP